MSFFYHFIDGVEANLAPLGVARRSSNIVIYYRNWQTRTFFCCFERDTGVIFDTVIWRLAIVIEVLRYDVNNVKLATEKQFSTLRFKLSRGQVQVCRNQQDINYFDC